MAVGKRLRFEILRRDNHTCRYCGASTPDVKLVIDHVIPEALGGRDEPENLVAACEPCNSGKTSIAPDGPMVAQVADDALRWSRAVDAAATRMLADHQARQADLVEFERHWNNAGRSWVKLPPEWMDSVGRFLALGLPMPLMLHAAGKAKRNPKIATGEVFRYMCGIAWKLLSEIQASATASLGISQSADELSDPAGHMLDDATPEELRRWENSARAQLDEGEDPSPAAFRSLVAQAAWDEHRYLAWRFEGTIDKLLGLFPADEVEPFLEASRDAYEENLPGDFSDADVLILAADRFAHARKPRGDEADTAERQPSGPWDF